MQIYVTETGVLLNFSIAGTYRALPMPAGTPIPFASIYRMLRNNKSHPGNTEQ
jgi:hypothetical protein